MAAQPRNLSDMLRNGGYEGENDGGEYPSSITNAPKDVLKRVRALKKYQLESLTIESEFYKRVHELEKEFAPKFDEVNAKRKAIVAGDYEPAENECDIPLIHGVDQSELDRLENEARDKPSKGIEGFWYNVLRNSTLVAELIQEQDEQVLNYLKDVTTDVHDNPTGFTLNFHFEQNPFFTNTVLQKYYKLDLDLEKDDPFNYDGPTVVKCQGTSIEWFPGRNVTEKVLKKRQKKGPNAGKMITKTVRCDSFFNFFNPEATETNPDMEDDLQDKVLQDFEIGQCIRDRIIPRAILFFTGEAVEEDEAYDDYGEDEEDEDIDGVNGDLSEDED